MRDHDQLALFHRALADFCRTGMPLGAAFRAVARDLAAGRLRAEAEAMAAEVEGGAPLGDAWRKRESVFPPVYAALVEAGAAGGDLPGTLEEIARHAALRAEAKVRIRRAVAYPVVMTVAVTGVAVVLFHTVVPQFAQMFSGMADGRGRPLEFPALTRMVVSLSGSGILILPAVALLVLALSYLRKPVDGLGMRVGLPFRLPVVGPMNLTAALATFTVTLEGLLRRGLPADRAMGLAAEAAEAPTLRAAAAAAAERIRGGEGLAAAIQAEGILPDSLHWFVASAERRGEPAVGLAEAAGLLQERLRRSFDRLLWAVVPLLDLFVGGMVLLVVLALFTPILSLQRALM